MDITIAIIILIYGLVIGSFLNVVIYRLPNEQSIISPPSHCGSCNTRLRPIDLIPVFSWIFLKGQCRYCGEKISARYALVELLTGTLFLLTYIYTGLSWVLLVNLILVSVLVAMTFIDYDHQIIPDEFHIFLIIVFVISNIAFK
ncbi:MAG: prepilin peptidase, partial [Eubacteriaceae bacterium]|nr:prepilin peptidase [Eubacteriaceae bacterium]